MSDTPTAVRIGVLGAARIAPNAILSPARNSAEAEVVAIAARDSLRAKEFAAKYDIAGVFGGYRELLADPGIDAVYIPLPNGLHGEWALAALEAGKHVLCEKPFAANATEARTVAAEAKKTGLVLMEAFHYRYHPLARRMREIVESGELGTLRHVEASFCFPLPRFSDIRYRFDLAGGALMDAGCYPVHMIRTLGSSGPDDEPTVVSAKAKRYGPDVDRAMRAELRFPAGHTARIRCSMWSTDILRVTARAVGTEGEMRVLNPLAPQLFHRMVVRTAKGRRVERFDRRPTYDYQLDAFTGAVLRDEPVLTGPEDAVANMTIIDAIYTAAGMTPREPS